MKTIDLRGITNMELVRGCTNEWYWSTDYNHGDLYEAEELFQTGHPVQSWRRSITKYKNVEECSMFGFLDRFKWRLYVKRKDVNYIYFETSAINFLLDSCEEDFIIFLRDYLKTSRNAKICLSPVSMWEIACTNDCERKEGLIRLCQILFDDFVLFPDPIKIMDHFISMGCPLIEPKRGFFNSEGSFEQVWREISDDLDKTITFDGDLRRLDKEFVAKISNLAKKLLKNNFTPIEDDSDPYYQPVSITIQNTYANLKFIAKDRARGYQGEHDTRYKLAIFFAYVLLLGGVSFGSSDIDEFWKKRRIDSIEKQTRYLFTKYESVIHRGPLLYMAMMAESQLSSGSNRGLYKDCLHAIYLPYCSMFFSRDTHFLQMKYSEPECLWGRIVNIEEFCQLTSSALSQFSFTTH